MQTPPMVQAQAWTLTPNPRCAPRVPVTLLYWGNLYAICIRQRPHITMMYFPMAYARVHLGNKLVFCVFYCSVGRQASFAALS